MRDKGFTLIELVLSFFIVTVAVSGAFVIIQKVVNSTSFSESNLIALFLAQEGLEIVRNIRDQNWFDNPDPSEWTNGLSDCLTASFCEGDYESTDGLNPLSAADQPRFLKINSEGFYGYGAGEITKFQRIIEIKSTDSSKYLSVKVVVRWQDWGKDYEFSLQEELYNWYRQP